METAKVSNKKIILLFLLAAAGIVFAFILSQTFYETKLGIGTFHSLCNMNDTVNCSAVASSSFSQLLPGWPLSSFAAGWYLAMILMSLMILWAPDSDWKKSSITVGAWMSLVGLVLSFFYFAIMAVVIKKFCIYCLALDAVNALIFVVFLTMKPDFKGLGAVLGSPKVKTYAGIVVGCVLVTVIGLKATLDSTEIPSDTIDQMVARIMDAPPVAVNVTDALPQFGAHDAPITLVEFIDFQCPHCRHGAMVLKAVTDKYPTKIRVVLKNFPLDSRCNRFVNHQMHPVACEAAKAVICAYRQNKFLPVYEEILDKQEELKPGSPDEIAAKHGLDSAQLQICAKSQEVTDMIAAGIEEGSHLGVQSTPTYFINGHKVEGVVPVAVWEKVLHRLQP